MITIPEAVAFNDAQAAYDAHNEKAKVLDIDLAIANRGGNAEQIAAAEAAKAEHSKAWHQLYKGHKEAALLLANALGVDPAKLRWALS